MHYYVECEMSMSKDKNYHTFRVRTDVGLLFMFQVSDRAALERWVNWFKGGSTVANNNNMIAQNKEEKKEDHQQAQQMQQEQQQHQQLDQLPLPKMQSATFGINDSSAGYSSFYNPSLILTEHLPQIIDDNSQSALYGPSSTTISESAIDRNMPMGNGNSFGLMVNNDNQNNGHSFGPIGNNNSFGVIDPSWKRYP